MEYADVYMYLLFMEKVTSAALLKSEPDRYLLEDDLFWMKISDNTNENSLLPRMVKVYLLNPGEVRLEFKDFKTSR